MMRNYRLPLLAFAALFLSLSWSCDPDKVNNPNYPFTVTIMTLEDSVRVSNVFVEILAQPGGGQSDVIFEGYTNEVGEASFEYDAEAVLLIRATRGTKPNYSWIGCDYIFLEPNERAERTVYIRPYDSEVEGC